MMNRESKLSKKKAEKIAELQKEMELGEKKIKESGEREIYQQMNQTMDSSEIEKKLRQLKLEHVQNSSKKK